MKKITAYDVANVFLKLGDTDSGDVLTNLKVQKLLYYAQGFSLALFDEPLFSEEISAWEHGPVVVDLYYKFKKFGYMQIAILEDIKDGLFTKEQLDLISEVNKVYGQFSAWKLRDMTHNETPWTTTQRGEVISNNKIKLYFKTQLQV
jgi:uncharacterized phage-associated protein